MTAISESYRKVFYDLRPAKQVERRMLLDAFQRLAAAGIPIRNSKYLGMGSIYFVDFVLFHKFLGLSRLHSVEINPAITKRVGFNKPFKCIDHSLESVGEYLSRVDSDDAYIVWLDYDDRISENMLQDISLAASKLGSPSVLLATIDVEPAAFEDAPDEQMELFAREAGELMPAGLDLGAFSRRMIAQTAARVVGNAIQRGLAGRTHVSFEPLFSFEYADGHRMVTAGGVIANEADKMRLRGADLSANYVRRTLEAPPFRIDVPRLTRRERAYLDQHMPLAKGWTPPDFEITTEELEQYSEIYQYFPQFGELIA